MTTRPDSRTVGCRAAEILNLLVAAEEYERLAESTRLYPDCWATFTGYPIIARWDLVRCRSPAAWDHLFASGMGPGPGLCSVGWVSMTAPWLGVKKGWAGRVAGVDRGA